MRLLSPIILILFSAVDGLWNQLSVSDSITTQFIRDDFPGFSAVVPR